MPVAGRIKVIDSHTGGEPTRVVIEGGPDLGRGSVRQQLAVLRSQHDDLRSAVINEPRGSDVQVGALLCPPADPTCEAGVIFFNNVGYLGMCGHGTIGLVVTLAHLGRIGPGEHRIETPVGVVVATIHTSGAVSVRNVPSYRFAHCAKVDVAADVAAHGALVGDVAWGGNWFFLVDEAQHRLDLVLSNVDRLTQFAWSVREVLAQQGITGAGGAEIDHIELFAPSDRADSRNFVLCPGKAYDRSPCGTGTSAKLACLVAEGALRPGQVWRQESIVGSVFEGTVSVADGQIVPTITGTAFITAEATLIFDPRDPFRTGIR
jgi:4-hydroxyproline epimerase